LVVLDSVLVSKEVTYLQELDAMKKKKEKLFANG
jgi:hydroxymethylpyrimidine/phosphomethylpyrimidine kinase